jgi:hypothetical protein
MTLCLTKVKEFMAGQTIINSYSIFSGEEKARNGLWKDYMVYAVDPRFIATISSPNVRPFSVGQRFYLSLIENAVDTVYNWLEIRRKGHDPTRSHDAVTKQEVDAAISWIDGCETPAGRYYRTSEKRVLPEPGEVVNYCYISRPGFISFREACDATYIDPSYFRKAFRQELQQYIKKWPYVLNQEEED